ncbi:TetR/AcrR family transcriptional regulator C-terminal domain-containing protein [Sphaerisporangium corydalis]|uniref:TetR/AcrR family transcriptional regulator C-terminal domain-containing protein n=1 Tax=Sphaerisporangium corydalis TaxID=1441875 RepID=A0ABV9EGH7_9ACTN|nr:TetR/AcrR family transcriptional regulator C-terminal domain-containing protein [Sphaerisporangium corydalis]
MASRRQEVLTAALDLLEEVGIDDLTVRRLAQRLGVQPGALYRHYPSKRALLDAMVGHIVAGAPAPAVPAGDWAGHLRAMAASGREGMLAHRDGARLLATFYDPGPDAVASFMRIVEVLRAAGAAERAAVVATDTVLAYVNGFTMEEQARRAATPRPERDRDFQAGLDLIIAGIGATLPPAP